MTPLSIDPGCRQAIDSFHSPESLGFGEIMCPVMLECSYRDEKWGELKMLPYGKISLEPSAKVLHYGQEIFEGMKAYRKEGGPPRLFRPKENWKRFCHSARRMAMPEIPEKIFCDAVRAITYSCRNFIPTQKGHSLYIRPFLFSTEAHVGIRPSTHYQFMVIASPCEAYLTQGEMNVLIQRQYVRAAPGGTGSAKTGGNYAASLISSQEAKKLGYQQTLWLDAIEKRYVEELSGMNFFALIGEDLLTPRLTDSILAGITRMSIIEMAKHLGLNVREEPIEIDVLKEQIQAGHCTEAFACGTAAIVNPITALCESSGEKVILPEKNGPITSKLREFLLNLQQGQGEDPFGWAIEVQPPKEFEL